MQALFSYAGERAPTATAARRWTPWLPVACGSLQSGRLLESARARKGASFRQVLASWSE